MKKKTILQAIVMALSAALMIAMMLTQQACSGCNGNSCPAPGPAAPPPAAPAVAANVGALQALGKSLSGKYSSWPSIATGKRFPKSLPGPRFSYEASINDKNVLSGTVSVLGVDISISITPDPKDANKITISVNDGKGVLGYAGTLTANISYKDGVVTISNLTDGDNCYADITINLNDNTYSTANVTGTLRK